MANPVYVADFETTTTKDDCRVWLWGITNTSGNFQYGTTIESFIDHLLTLKKCSVYFHNLSFDGSFLLDHMLKNGWQHHNRRRGRGQWIETLIDDMGKFYTITINHAHGRVEIKDSLKKLPMSVSAIAGAFDLGYGKGDIDYHAPRPIGYQPTDDEIEYVRRDVQIVADALAVQHREGLTKLTVGADALSTFKANIPSYEAVFPLLDPAIDDDIRRAYRGGFTYVNPRYQGQIVGAGSSYDVNSLYPYVMYHRPLPYGYPIYADTPEPTADYPLWIGCFTVEAKLKPGHIPCIQLKNTPGYVPTAYLSDISEPTDIVVTNVDWELIQEHYDVSVLACNGAYMFQARSDIFRGYIDYWAHIKATTTGGMRTLAKLMMNSLYGKLCTGLDVTGRIPIIENDVLKLVTGPEETRDPVYTPAGTFVTSWARDYTIRGAQALGERFMYADTDSLHILGTEPPAGLTIHPTDLGAWKHEYDFTRARYVRAKCYAEEMMDGSTLTRIAGLPEAGRAPITVDNLTPGAVFAGKLRPVRVPGGIVLEPIDFTIKP